MRRETIQMLSISIKAESASLWDLVCSWEEVDAAPILSWNFALTTLNRREWCGFRYRATGLTRSPFGLVAGPVVRMSFLLARSAWVGKSAPSSVSRSIAFFHSLGTKHARAKVV